MIKLDPLDIVNASTKSTRVEKKLPINYRKATLAQRAEARSQYIKEQQGLCYCCHEPLTKEPAAEILVAPIDWNKFPATFQNYPVHLHHNHITGMTIGVVHMRCNAYLWQYKGE